MLSVSSVVISAASPAAVVVSTEGTTDCLTADKILFDLLRDLRDEVAPWTIWLWTFKTDCLEKDFPQVEHVTGLGLIPILPFVDVDGSNEVDLRLECIILGMSGFLFSEWLWLSIGFVDLLFRLGDKDEFWNFGVMVIDEDGEKDGTEGTDFVETIGLPLTECALKFDWGEPGLGCV